jgi:hypothetical protein
VPQSTIAHAFTFHANGLLRELDPGITAAELSGQVFNPKISRTSMATIRPSKQQGRLVIRNQNGVILSVVATAGGHKFTLGADGMTIELKK